MKIDVRRIAAAVAVPVMLLGATTACGSESEEPGSKPAAETAETEAAAAPETEAAEETEAAAPAAGEVPDPRNDPEGFEDYLTEMYVKAGMTDDQATCMSAAFMDNVDLDAITDPSSVSALMGDEKLTEAMTKCV
ncbi:hypothetical protein WBG06_10845 [Nocardioides sp. CCNWLW239]|uniref:hypothetical protein n=1 Tax=Nocardioides sp. CCNWLW239 TaxID=3128902 RepID=UPI00301AE717